MFLFCFYKEKQEMFFISCILSFVLLSLVLPVRGRRWCLKNISDNRNSAMGRSVLNILNRDDCNSTVFELRLLCILCKAGFVFNKLMEFKVMVSKRTIRNRVSQIKLDIGIRLCLLREEREMSLEEVAEACGISACRIKMIEDGRSFSLKHLFMLASVYGVRVKILFK